jgi:peroxiredoxin Q/BCP
MFYQADFTSGCTLEAQYFERDYDKYKDLNVQLVGVSVDSVEKHLDFRKKCQLDFPLLSDKNGDISNKYGSLLNLGFVGKFSNRQTYIISPESKIEYVFTDVDGNLSSHSGDVLAKLQELQQLK